MPITTRLIEPKKIKKDNIPAAVRNISLSNQKSAMNLSPINLEFKGAAPIYNADQVKDLNQKKLDISRNHRIE